MSSFPLVGLQTARASVILAANDPGKEGPLLFNIASKHPGTELCARGLP